MRYLLPVLAAAALSACTVVIAPERGRYVMALGAAVPGNGQIVRESRAIAAADAVDLSGPISMQVRVGGAPGLEVEGDANLLPLIRTELQGHTLKVWLDGRVSDAARLHVTYSTPSLASVVRNGSGELSVDGLQGGNLQVVSSGSGSTSLRGAVAALNLHLQGSGGVDAYGLQTGGGNVNLNGSGKVTLGPVEGVQLVARLNGSGTLKARGRVQQLQSQLNGSGSLDLDDVVAEQADLVNTGSGSISATVRRAVGAQTVASGSITVRGNPAERRANGRNVRFAG